MYKISKNITKEIKGFAILLMLFHHFLTFPSWVVAGSYSPNLKLAAYLNSPSKLCVCIFAFLTGWAYALNKDITIKSSLNKIFKFLLTYWLIVIPMILLAVVLCDYRPIAKDLFTELTGLSTEIMIFCWYVPFFIVSMIILPPLVKVMDRSLIWSGMMGVVLPIVFFWLLMKVTPQSNLKLLFNNLKHWFPCISTGYICNKYNVFLFFSKFTRKVNSKLLFMVSIVGCGVGRYYISALDFIYCVVIVFALSNLINISKKQEEKVSSKILLKLGMASTNMWFLHCIFFSSITREMFQPIVYWSQNPVIVYLTAVIILYCIAMIFIKIKHITVCGFDNLMKKGVNKRGQALLTNCEQKE